MKIHKTIIAILIFLGLSSCASNSVVSHQLKEPIITKNESLDNYKYVFISANNDVTSSDGMLVGSSGSVYGGSITRSINPSDIIRGILMKNDHLLVVPVIKPELESETLIVNFGESGRRNIFPGYSIEVTINFVSAKTYNTVAKCTAEGMGVTEADDVRIAINRCLNGLFTQSN